MSKEIEKEFVGRLQDPLSGPTRNARRNLLGVSFASVVVVRLGLVPTKVSALGIELAPGDQRNLLLVFACVVAYFSIVFVIYGLADYLAVRLAVNSKEASDLSYSLDGPPPPDEYEGLAEQREAWLSSSIRMLRARIAIEFAFPLLLALLAVFDLTRELFV